MKTVPVPERFISFDDEGNVKDIDMIAYLNSLPEKHKIHVVIDPPVMMIPETRFLKNTLRL